MYNKVKHDIYAVVHDQYPVDMPEVLPILKVDASREKGLAAGLAALFIPVPQGKFPSGRVDAVKRLAYFYSLRTEINEKLMSMGMTDQQARSDYSLMMLITILIQEYQVPLD